MEWHGSSLLREELLVVNVEQGILLYSAHGGPAQRLVQPPPGLAVTAALALPRPAFEPLRLYIGYNDGSVQRFAFRPAALSDGDDDAALMPAWKRRKIAGTVDESPGGAGLTLEARTKALEDQTANSSVLALQCNAKKSLLCCLRKSGCVAVLHPDTLKLVGVQQCVAIENAAISWFPWRDRLAPFKNPGIFDWLGRC